MCLEQEQPSRPRRRAEPIRVFNTVDIVEYPVLGVRDGTWKNEMVAGTKTGAATGVVNPTQDAVVDDGALYGVLWNPCDSSTQTVNRCAAAVKTLQSS